MEKEKIDYNKYTHEINFIKVKEHTFMQKVRKRLTKNKIFIIVIPSFFLTIMSVIISVIGVVESIKSTEIYNKQLEIMENDREPYFILKSKPIDGVYSGNGYNYTKRLCTIENGGGLITGACLFPVYTEVKIEIFNKKLGKRCTYILIYSGLFEDVDIKNSSFLYDIESKTFRFYILESDKFNNFIHNLQLELEKTFPPSEENKWMERIQISYDNKVEIQYINYKNIEYNQVYKVNSYDRMTLISPEENDEVILLGNASIEEDYRYIIRDVCKEIKESMTLESGKPNSLRNPQYGTTKENREDAIFDAKHCLSSDISFSRVQLIENLEKLGYIHEDAVYAADNCGADWNEQAVKTAENYLFFEPYSYNKLLEALTSIEKFTHDQAIYGINNCEVDWNYQAERRIQVYVHENKSCSYDELIKLLEEEGYTHEQAVYGVEHNGYTQ